MPQKAPQDEALLLKQALSRHEFRSPFACHSLCRKPSARARVEDGGSPPRSPHAPGGGRTYRRPHENKDSKDCPVSAALSDAERIKQEAMKKAAE